MELDPGNYVIFGDLHGRVDKAQAVYKEYGDWPDGYIATGDVNDGLGNKTNSKESINFLMRIGAVTVDSNHGRNAVDAMCHPDDDVRNAVALLLWARSQAGMLADYGIYPAVASPQNALRLREKMQQVGHLDFLTKAPPYIEGEDFVVIHGDLTALPWQDQKASLDCYAKTGVWLGENGLYPYHLGQDIKEVVETNLVCSGLTKTLISGHFHRSTADLVDRKLNNGQHLLLATAPKNDFVVVYETWTQQMRTIEV